MGDILKGLLLHILFTILWQIKSTNILTLSPLKKDEKYGDLVSQSVKETQIVRRVNYPEK